MLPLTPGMTMVAEAMQPSANSLMISPTDSVMTALLLASTALSSTTAAKNAANTTMPGAPVFSPFICLRIMGTLPRIRPMKSALVGRGKERNAALRPNAPTITASTMPTA